MTAQPMALKYLSQDLFEKLKSHNPASEFSIEDIVRSGRENSDSSIGAYAADAESYQLYAEFFDQIIQDYHGTNKDMVHKTDFDSQSIDRTSFDSTNKRVISTRIRVARNFSGFLFPPAIAKQDRLEVERRAVEILEGLSGELAGQYYSLDGMDEKTRIQLVEDHFLFKKGDRFLESAGVNRDWPQGRGIFFSNDKKFLVWVNEEDHLRIISMQTGGDILAVFDRLKKAITAIESQLKFAYSDRYGYLTSCPTNLGTAMRASVHINLKPLCDAPHFKELCADLGLSIRGIHGEHSESNEGIFDISNKQRLGVSEVETVMKLATGVEKLLKILG